MICDDARGDLFGPEVINLERFADELDLAQYQSARALDVAIAEIRSRNGGGVGREDCQDCGREIPSARLRYVPNAIRCAPCQDRQERLRDP
jgi:phage/conjugal plasmid C-4 type zinc finger TraR family protein